MLIKTLSDFTLDKMALNNLNKYRLDGAQSGIGGIDSYTKLMLHMNGANGSTVFTDSSLVPKTVTPNGSAQISTAQSMFGGTSGSFDGSGDFLSIADHADFEFGNGDFTIDFDVRFNNVSTEMGLVYKYISADRSFIIYKTSSNVIAAVVYDTSQTAYAINSSVTVTSNTWYHIAYVRNGSTLTLYINGASVGTSNIGTSSLKDSTASLLIGKEDVAGFDFNGYIDELRISKGIARWTTNFTPPTSEYTT